MPLVAPDDLIRRICLAYPWSPQCKGVAAIIPSPGEQGAMTHSIGGYQAATGKNIPIGARCESVQLIPVDQIGKRTAAAIQSVNRVQPPNEVHLQFRPPFSREMNRFAKKMETDRKYFEEGLATVTNLLRNRKFEEAIAHTGTFIDALEAYCISASVSPSLDKENRGFRTVLGIAYFFHGDNVKASEWLLSFPHTTGNLCIDFLSNENIAVITILTAIWNLKICRRELLTILCDSVHSVVKDYFDVQLFSEFRELGYALEDCRYTDALDSLERRLEDLYYIFDGSIDLRPLIYESFRARCALELITTHKEISLRALADDLGIESHEIKGIVVDLIHAKALGWTDHRIDSVNEIIVAQEKCADVYYTECLSNIEQAVSSAQLIRFMSLIAERSNISNLSKEQVDR